MWAVRRMAPRFEKGRPVPADDGGRHESMRTDVGHRRRRRDQRPASGTSATAAAARPPIALLDLYPAGGEAVDHAGGAATFELIDVTIGGADPQGRLHAPDEPPDLQGRHACPAMRGCASGWRCDPRSGNGPGGDGVLFRFGVSDGRTYDELLRQHVDPLNNSQRPPLDPGHRRSLGLRRPGGRPDLQHQQQPAGPWRQPSQRLGALGRRRRSTCEH